MKRAEILSLLTTIGTPLGAEYNQRKGTNHIRLKHLVGEGMCLGVTMDWIRRELTGGNHVAEGNPFVADTSDAAKGVASANADRNLKQYAKAAKLQLAASSANKDKFYVDFEKSLMKKFNAKQDATQEAIAKAGEIAETQEEYDAIVQKLQAEFTRWKKEVYTVNNATENKWRMFWEYYCRTLTGNVGKHEEHRLSNLTVVESSPTKVYAGGLKEYVPKLLKTIGINQAANAGFGPPIANQAGHVVGIHRLNTSSIFHFFEPNFGVFRMDVQNLAKALLFLFGVAYPDSEGLAGDGQRYEVNGMVQGDYVIFTKR